MDGAHCAPYIPNNVIRKLRCEYVGNAQTRAMKTNGVESTGKQDLHFVTTITLPKARAKPTFPQCEEKMSEKHAQNKGNPTIVEEQAEASLPCRAYS